MPVRSGLRVGPVCYAHCVMAVVRWVGVLALLGLPACKSSDAAPAPTAVSAEPAKAALRPQIVEGPRNVDSVAPFIHSELLRARRAGERVVVYVGATWCEPCRRFHKALASGQLDKQLAGVRFIEFDLDQSGKALARDGYRSEYIPLFAVPTEDGRDSGRQIAGSIKGPGAVDQIMPRLGRLLASEALR